MAPIVMDGSTLDGGGIGWGEGGWGEGGWVEGGWGEGGWGAPVVTVGHLAGMSTRGRYYLSVSHQSVSNS